MFILSCRYPEQAFAVAADATNEAQVESAFSAAVARFGVISYLVVNHATFESVDFGIVDMSLEQWKTTLDVNLTGSFLFVRSFLRQLRKHAEALSPEQRAAEHASVAIIGSTAGIFGEAFHADYAASKSALHTGFLRSLKNEIVNIVPRATANVVAPGWVNTKMATESIAAGKHLKALTTMPLKKLATTDDVANAVLVALSPVTGGHMTGQVIELAGGMEGRVLWPNLQRDV